jgi:methionyl aminopeptidase
MTIAIEPFASTGRGWIEEVGQPEVFMLTAAPRQRKGLDKRVMGSIDSWRGLPIARRYFSQFEPEAVDRTLRSLARQGVLREFGPLVEAAGEMTAQVEHSLFVADDRAIVLTA